MTFNVKAKQPHNAGDGMALWFVEDALSPGTAFGASETFKGLGVFFDLYANKKQGLKFPYVSAMINDGTKRYNHETDGAETMAGGCSAALLNTDVPVHAKVAYNNGVLEVHLFSSHDSGWVPCLKVNNVKLPKSGYIGVTAVTGDATAAHEVIGITTGTYKHGSGDRVVSAVRDNVAVL